MAATESRADRRTEGSRGDRVRPSQTASEIATRIGPTGPRPIGAAGLSTPKSASLTLNERIARSFTTSPSSIRPINNGDDRSCNPGSDTPSSYRCWHSNTDSRGCMYHRPRYPHSAHIHTPAVGFCPWRHSIGPLQLFNQHTVDAPAMPDAHRLQVYPFRAALNPDAIA